MTTDTRRGLAALLALPGFLATIWIVGTVEDIILIGECGVGPAAPTSCEWSDLNDPAPTTTQED